jgi:tetratricopeptide (TPR) repeat protein
VQRPGSAFGAAVATYRFRRGLTKAELLRRSRLKEETLAAYERGKRQPLPRHIARLSVALGQRPRRLLDLARLLDAVDQLPPEAPLSPAIESLSLWTGFAGLLAEAGGEIVAPNDSWVEYDDTVPDQRDRAMRLVRRLRELPIEERPLCVEGLRCFRGSAVLQRLGEESTDRAGDSPAKAEHWAHLAFLVARLTPGSAGMRCRRLAHGKAYQANARRVGGDLLGAQQGFGLALELYNRGEPAPGLDDARFWDLLASLRRDQRRFEGALELLDRAVAAAPDDDLGRLFVSRAKTLEEMGRNEDAIADLRRAIAVLEPGADPRLAWIARLNFVVNLCDLGRAAEGAPWLTELGDFVRTLGNDLDQIHFRWVEGRVHAGCERWEEAAAALEDVCLRFLAHGVVYLAALASLDLAIVFLEQGKTKEVKEVTRQLVPLFDALQIEREALASLRLFCAAAEAEAATLVEARRLRALLRRAERRGEPTGRAE